MKIGVIADDFTGATDIASFLVENGLSTMQFNGTPKEDETITTDAVVISLKSRSIPKDDAISISLEAMNWLKSKGCDQIYFKYCSTFDSTEKGNIGPVTDAILEALNETTTIISPALPVNGRTVYKGYLFVLNQLLSESPMKNHPLNPMHDSNLMRLMEMQGKGKAGLITSDDLDKGAEFVKSKIDTLSKEGFNYIVLDALNEAHLVTQGEAVKSMPFVTGGSGLAIGLARALTKGNPTKEKANVVGYPVKRESIVLSGSCSAMTNRQVDYYRSKAPSFKIDVAKVINTNDRASYVKEILDWLNQNKAELAPLIYATSNPEDLADIQKKHGAEKASHAVEETFKMITEALKESNIKRFIIAGGETSGIVTQALGVESFFIGPVISPGVPWVKGIKAPISLALKSGNFGDEAFFERAQKEFP